jgi:thiamine-phosphate pyrophosphorylase
MIAGSTVPCRLYAIVDPLDTGRDPVDLARAMLAGGARLLQLRLKNVASGTLLATADRIRDLTAGAGATFLVNDRVDVALACGAEGVHVGLEDLPVDDVRRLVGADRLVGFSTHDEVQIRAAGSSAASYLSFGPIYATTSKRNPDPVLGPARLAAVRPQVTKPVVAIGGITAATIPAVLAAGADAVAIIAALVRAPDVERATAELVAAAERA